MRTKFTFILLMLFTVGCSYTVDTVKPDKITTAYEGKVLPATMNLYLSEELKSKTWEGHPSSFVGSVHTFQVPLGNIVSSASKKTFQKLFEKLHIVSSVKEVKDARGTIIPSIKDYSFRIDGMTLISPGTLVSDISMHFKILDKDGEIIWEENVQGTGKKKQSNMAMINAMGSWKKDLPFTTEEAVKDALEKISSRISDSDQVKKHLKIKQPYLAENFSDSGGQKASLSSNFRLYVNATPSDSKIRILNIKPVYIPGIELNLGDYHLEVSRKGYTTVRKWISVKSGENVQVDIDLTQQIATEHLVLPQQKSFLPQEDQFRQHWAVIIGVSRYSDTRIQSLRYANADAEYFYNWLISSTGGEYSPNNIKLLLDKEATSKNIKDALFNWLRQAIEKDVVIIIFAGHGSPDSPDTPENLYLLPYDTQYDNIAATGFPMWDVETAIKRFIKAKRIIVIADACHSGGVGQSFDVARRSTRGIGVNPISTRLEQLSKAGKGVAVISASGDKQTSQEGSQWGGGHGVFTYYLMEALKGNADYNQDNKVSLGELIPYLSEQVRRATKSAQSPTVSGKFDPALAIAK
ncbi:MAG: caspase family protein [Desulfobacteraceae bacterium]|nr:caspase family protein [Desulfobacteraceae bacterium]